MKDNAERKAFTTVQLADPVAHLDAIGTPRTLHWAFAHREYNRIALS